MVLINDMTFLEVVDDVLLVTYGYPFLFSVGHHGMAGASWIVTEACAPPIPHAGAQSWAAIGL